MPNQKRHVNDNAPPNTVVIGPKANAVDNLEAVAASEAESVADVDVDLDGGGGVRGGMHPDHDIMADYSGFLQQRNNGREMERDTMMSQIDGMVNNLN